MRFGTAISLLCAVASVTPLAFAAPVASDSTDSFEARGFDVEVADLVARSDFDEATSLLARAVADYSKKDPLKPKNHFFKPKPGPSRPRDLAEVDDMWAREDDGLWAREFDDELWAREDLEEMWAREVADVLSARTDPPPYDRHDPIHGAKPKYSKIDPNPPPKYSKKDPLKPKNHFFKPKPGPSRPRELVDTWW
ncbi:hypothetical protein EVJ58_g4130 [Rhodofomes roseus]|uniref:Uncharacterized protein n=1 Tax=Rhodofomes roseus TaxID=34475 RepID=A0A4Y9YK81_9APHY|nr:hypothetical protein EVJ58_g4130 [Rhodofomes roseus]